MPPTHSVAPEDRRPPDAVTLAELLKAAQMLAAYYYRVTGKLLGVTGEIAELEAADKLRLTLCPPRTAWYDAVDDKTSRKVQIKGKAVDPGDRYRGMCSAIRCSDLFEDVVLVLLDRSTSRPLEMWRTTQAQVQARVAGLSSDRRRSNGTLAVTQFTSIATRVWSADDPFAAAPSHI